MLGYLLDTWLASGFQSGVGRTPPEILRASLEQAAEATLGSFSRAVMDCPMVRRLDEETAASRDC
jgi:hypothetical protein